MTTPTKTEPKRAHQWRLDSEGEPDLFFLAYDYCNGPFCEVCLKGFCVNCTPGWSDTECEGDDGTDTD